MNSKIDPKDEISLVNALAYIKSNFDNDELSNIPTKDWKKFDAKLAEYKYDGHFVSYDDLNDADKTMIVALLKKYFFNDEQNAKLDSIFEEIENHRKNGGAHNE